MAYVWLIWSYGIHISCNSCSKHNLSYGNRELLRVARIKTAAGYGLFVVLCAMIQCLYNKPDIADNGLGSIFTYCADYKAGGGFLADCYARYLAL